MNSISEVSSDEIEEKSDYECFSPLDLEISETMANEILNGAEGSYTAEEILHAKTVLLRSQYKHLAELSQTAKEDPDPIFINELYDEMINQKTETEDCREQAENLLSSSKIKDYNLAQEMLDLFLDKEQWLDQIIRTKGQKIAKLNQMLNDLNHLKNLLTKKEILVKEVGSNSDVDIDNASDEDKNKIIELKKINGEIEEYKNKLNGKKIEAPQSFYGMSSETKIEFPNTDDMDELKDSISKYVDEAKLRVKQGFSSLQEDFTAKMACFESTKNALKHFEESVSRIVRNQKANG